MERPRPRLTAVAFTLLTAAAGLAQAAGPATPAGPSLVGTWTLAAADDIRPDGSRVPAYGPNPQGLLFLGQDGRYSVQIFRSSRTRFASGDKRRGTPEEYQAAVLDVSSHFGRYAVDAASGIITFHIELASFPNWDGTEQRRPFELKDDELSWRVPGSPDGRVPISVWRRAR
jgi:hypothetical protein